MTINLPLDVMQEIVSLLEPNDTCVLGAVSSSWRAAVRGVGGDAALAIPFRIDSFLKSEDAVRWAVANGCPLTPRVFRHAVQAGNMKVLYALYDLNCPRDSSVCMEAATQRNLDALQWMHSRRFEWNFLVCFAAAGADTKKSRKILNWLGAIKTCPCKRSYH